MPGIVRNGEANGHYESAPSPVTKLAATPITPTPATSQQPAPQLRPAQTLEDLAWSCARSAVSITQYLASTNHSQPSILPGGPANVLPKDAPVPIKRSRQSLMSAALQLFQLAAGPSEFVPSLAPGFQYVACLTWLLKFKILEIVPKEGSIGYVELAAEASRRANENLSATASDKVVIPEARLKGIVRMAMTSGLFLEPQSGQVSHSATSYHLATNEDARAWASYLCNRSAPTALALTTAHECFGPASVAKNETAYNIAFDTDLPFFDHLALNPASTAEFAGYMRNVTSSEAVDVKHLVQGYDWASLGPALVVDVGGSTGNADIALAKVYPDLKFVVQDLPENASAGQKNALATLSSDILSRLTFQGHDFTKPQPVKDGNIYLLRMILHDWPDHVSITILRQLVPALTEQRANGTRPKLLVMDTVLPAPGQVPVSVERNVRVRDMTMMQVFNSHERDLEQWTALLAAADARLKIRQVIEPFGSAMSLLEVEVEEFTSPELLENCHDEKANGVNDLDFSDRVKADDRSANGTAPAIQGAL
jgi:6-hydroxytryprostatin B O-methyltransferase